MGGGRGREGKDRRRREDRREEEVKKGRGEEEKGREEGDRDTERPRVLVSSYFPNALCHCFTLLLKFSPPFLKTKLKFPSMAPSRLLKQRNKLTSSHHTVAASNAQAQHESLRKTVTYEVFSFQDYTTANEGEAPEAHSL